MGGHARFEFSALYPQLRQRSAVVLLSLWPVACDQDAAKKGAADVDPRRLVEAPAAEADFLEALGYVDGTVDPEADQKGVLIHQAGRVSPGLNLYYSRTQKHASLLDMAGAEVFRWEAETSDPWQHVHLDPQTGGLLVLMKDVGLIALDRDGNERWRWEGRAHHDLWVDDAGRIHMLARHARSMPDRHATIDVLEDVVVVLSPDGEPLGEWSVLDALATSPYAFLLPDLGRVKKRKRGHADLDILHTNHIQVFDGQQAAASPLFREGDVLLSLRNINVLMILDGESHDVRWIWGPSNLTFQHHPTVLDNGHMLVFNNRTARSEVLEFDPTNGAAKWRYGGRKDFFSKTRGSAQRLENGNTLITESDAGYVFEVTPDGETVWEFANPDVDDDGLRGAIWRMTRYPPGTLPFLDSAATTGPGAGK
jgi:hypothetical protein